MNCPRCDAPATDDDLRLYGGVCPACVLDFAAERDAPEFPGLEIVSVLGEGGMGIVYKATQKRLGRTVALKVLSPQLASDPHFVERFTREAQALAQLDHPNIVAIHDFGVHDGVPYLVMEHVEGVSLRKLLASKKLAPERALEIVPQVCDALAYAHAHGVVHRDIKPENVLLDRAGRVKIADFGLAKLAGMDDRRLTRTNMIMGSPSYMAPEQIETPGTVDHRADIYSLGVVFYEMLTGELPIGRFKAPSEKADVDARLDPVVLKSLEKEPDHRWQAAEDVKSEVTRVRALPPGRAPRAAGFPHLALTSLILAFADAICILWLFLDGGGKLQDVVRKLVGNDGVIFPFILTIGALASVFLGLVALGRMAAGRDRSCAWMAILGVLLSGLLLPAPLLGAAALGAAALVTAIYLALAVLLRFVYRDLWARTGDLVYAALLFGLVAAALLVFCLHSPDTPGRSVAGVVCMFFSAGLAALLLLAAWIRSHRPAAPPPSPRRPSRRPLVIAAALMAALTMGLSALLWKTRSIPAPPQVPNLQRPAGDVWPTSAELPKGLRFDAESRDELWLRTLRAARKDLDADLAERRQASLRDGRIWLYVLRFWDEATRLRWQQDPVFQDFMSTADWTISDGPYIVFFTHAKAPEVAADVRRLGEVLLRKLRERPR